MVIQLSVEISLSSHLGNAQASLALLSVWRQFVAMGLILLDLYLAGRANGLLMDANLVVMAVLALAALVVCVGATNVYNFMDGINGCLLPPKYERAALPGGSTATRRPLGNILEIYQPFG